MSTFELRRYLASEQPETDGDRTVEAIDGDADAITQRGEDIEELGDLMQRAAATLAQSVVVAPDGSGTVLVAVASPQPSTMAGPVLAAVGAALRTVEVDG